MFRHGASRSRVRAAAARGSTRGVTGSGRRPPAGARRHDIIATIDQPTQNGSPIAPARKSPFDAECGAAGAGAFALGKMQTEFLRAAGKTRNPWNATHTPGGSSSGSAAAVALGQVPLNLARKPTGSFRPAAYYGVASCRLTCAVVRRHQPVQPYVDTPGVLARTVGDCALVIAASPMTLCSQEPLRHWRSRPVLRGLPSFKVDRGERDSGRTMPR
jgi:amidase